ncbi:membrane protein YczE [Nocardioides acrostichi]|uniref:Membrane protein YczE n=1 Tax=Nocardioides acrostichi TaxID=2784339 RepID=A0A930V1D6_9ACTN|nr:hypothetical protein [Nocardioides acrostichi]MBF4161434.1 hypothetical protein [Nocardioides acrostichi]
MTRRLVQLLVGVGLYGVSIGLLVRSTWGLSPWDVLPAGLQRHTSMSFGEVVIVVGLAVLLLWIPLRQRPGVATLVNVICVGGCIDATLRVLPPTESPALKAALLAGGVLLNGFAGALYLGARLGSSARDGLMTGLARRTSWSLRAIRTGIELTALGVGIALGGAFGVGTVVYALSIGPLVQWFLPWCQAPLRQAAPPPGVT